MKTNNDSIPIGKFVRQTPGNLEIATAIYKEYERVREEIVKDFFARVKKTLQQQSKNLRSWEFSYDGGFFIDRYSAFRFFKKAWKDHYDIRIEAYDYGNRMIYGVWRNPDLVGRIQRKSAILQAVRQRIPKATSRSYFEAEIWMDSPEPDWRESKVIWRMLKDKKFELELVALLLEFVDLTENYVDQLLRTKANR